MLNIQGASFSSSLSIFLYVYKTRSIINVNLLIESHLFQLNLTLEIFIFKLLTQFESKNKEYSERIC